MRRAAAVACVLAAAVSAAAGRGPLPEQLVNVNRRGPQLLPVSHAGTAVHEQWDGRLTARATRTAVDDAVMYLRGLQRPDGSIGGPRRTALAALAMLAAGVDPASDPQLRKALHYMAERGPNDTYVRGIRANAWEYALRKVPHDKKVRAALKADFDWLMAALKRK